MSITETLALAKAGLPPSIQQLRYKDLKEAKIVTTHAQLNRRIEREGFPKGRWIGENVRSWTVEEVLQWLASRPSERPDTVQIKAAKAYQRKLKRQRAARASA